MQSSEIQKLRAQAHRLYQSGDAAGAEKICRQLLQLPSPPSDAPFLLGVIAQDAGQLQKAGEFYQRATELDPKQAIFHNAMGEIHVVLGRHAQALACFRRAIELRANFDRAHYNLGFVLHAQGDLPGARASFEQAIRLNPRDSTAHNNLGAVLNAQGELERAAACFRQAIALQANYPESHLNLGNVLLIQGDPIAAARSFREAIRLDPHYARAHLHLAQALEQQHDYKGARTGYETAARLKPDDPEIHRLFGDFLLVVTRDLSGAIAAFERAVALKPDDPVPFANLARGRQLICDWRTYQTDSQRLWTDSQTRLAAGEVPAIVPFQSLTLPWSRQRLLTIARSHCELLQRQQRASKLAPLPQQARTRNGRLRVGYLSGDFFDHPISHLLHGLFGRHDRERFEIFVYSFSPTDNSSYQRRIQSESEHFVNVSGLAVPQLAQRIHADEIHILIDLMGHTGTNRLGALALRPAPIQASYLGMLGTMGADFIDYLLTDAVATPAHFAPDFTEKFVTLPHSYLLAEPEPPAAVQPLSRSENGLPQDAFVFCGFNNTYKIEPQMFDVWMKILNQVPGSVLWLFSGAAVVENNLRREAAARGVAAERLIFAPFKPRSEHLLRHSCADLFLDTLVYNGAATTSLALQMGLPVLVCCGETFASRVGASLLSTAGMPELIAANLEEYQRLAVHLAGRRDELKQLSQRLIAGRDTSPLFDTLRFVRNLERAYEAMWTIYASGRPAEPITVDETLD